MRSPYTQLDEQNFLAIMPATMIPCITYKKRIQEAVQRRKRVKNQFAAKLIVADESSRTEGRISVGLNAWLILSC